MTFTFTHRLRTTLLATVSLLSFAGAASAEECGDISCDEGFDCHTYGSGDDASYSCDRAACESDDECGPLMVCGTYDNDCEGLRVACADGGCDPGLVADCQPEFHQCAPTWELECETDADCGEGFECVTEEVCDCPKVEPGSDDEPVEEPVCDDCHPSDVKWCNALTVDCSDDSDCPTHWECVETGFGACDSDGNCDDGSQLTCQPPSAVYGETSGVLTLAASSEPGDLAAESGQAATLGDGEPSASDEDLIAEETPTAEVAEDGTDDKNAIDDDGLDAKDVESMADGGPESSGGGCTVASVPSGNTSSGLALLAFGLGALFVGRRRRAG